LIVDEPRSSGRYLTQPAGPDKVIHGRIVPIQLRMMIKRNSKRRAAPWGFLPRYYHAE
jgi:hypothetical protein